MAEETVVDRRNRARTVVNQLNAEAVVALIERQNLAIKEADDRLAAMEARITLLEQRAQLQEAEKFKLMAEQMGSGSTSGS